MRLLFSKSASPHHGFAAYYTYVDKVSFDASIHHPYKFSYTLSWSLLKHIRQYIFYVLTHSRHPRIYPLSHLSPHPLLILQHNNLRPAFDPHYYYRLIIVCRYSMLMLCCTLVPTALWNSCLVGLPTNSFLPTSFFSPPLPPSHISSWSLSSYSFQTTLSSINLSPPLPLLSHTHHTHRHNNHDHHHYVGKQVGMSGQCYPDRLISQTPNIYYYAANNPSEATIAKRRSYASTVSYLTPPAGAWCTV